MEFNEDTMEFNEGRAIQTNISYIIFQGSIWIYTFVYVVGFSGEHP